MVVADDDRVNGRQVLEGDAGSVEARGADPAEGAGALGPDGVGEDVQALGLDQEGGVVDEGDAEFLALDALGRGRPLGVGALGPGAWLSAGALMLNRCSYWPRPIQGDGLWLTVRDLLLADLMLPSTFSYPFCLMLDLWPASAWSQVRVSRSFGCRVTPSILRSSIKYFQSFRTLFLVKEVLASTTTVRQPRS